MELSRNVTKEMGLSRNVTKEMELSRNVTKEMGLSRNVTKEEEQKRPGRQPVYQVGVTTKLTLPEIQRLDALAAQAHLSRYELMRRVLVDTLQLKAEPDTLGDETPWTPAHP